ncbi:MAG: energy-coupling factor ABC transporter ATP-binding protein [Candidatus Krumholzibacteriia bacterium]
MTASGSTPPGAPTEPTPPSSGGSSSSGSPPTGELLLEARNVHVWYQRGLPGEGHALRGVTLGVRAGDRVGLMGRSGSGKSTLLHVFCRLLDASEGSVWSAESEVRLPSLVFQFPERQLFAESVLEDVAYGLRESGIHDVEERVQRALRDVGLAPEEFGARPPVHLSGGEKRRVALAGALAQRRGVVFLDEPTLGIDREGVERLVTILAGLHERGIACWVASHDADFVGATCTELVVLDAGRVAFRGPAAEFWRDSQRASSLGIRLPRESTLAEQLRCLGVRSLPPRPSEEQLGAALASLRSLGGHGG